MNRTGVIQHAFVVQYAEVQLTVIEIVQRPVVVQLVISSIVNRTGVIQHAFVVQYATVTHDAAIEIVQCTVIRNREPKPELQQTAIEIVQCTVIRNRGEAAEPFLIRAAVVQRTGVVKRAEAEYIYGTQVYKSFFVYCIRCTDGDDAIFGIRVR